MHSAKTPRARGVCRCLRDILSIASPISIRIGTAARIHSGSALLSLLITPVGVGALIALIHAAISLTLLLLALFLHMISGEENKRAVICIFT